MVGIAVRVQKRDGDRLDAARNDRADETLDFGVVERVQDRPVGEDALVDLEPQVARHELAGRLDREVVHVVAMLAADLEDVAEALVVMSAVGAPLRSMMAFVTSVVP